MATVHWKDDIDTLTKFIEFPSAQQLQFKQDAPCTQYRTIVCRWQVIKPLLTYNCTHQLAYRVTWSAEWSLPIPCDARTTWRKNVTNWWEYVLQLMISTWVDYTCCDWRSAHVIDVEVVGVVWGFTPFYDCSCHLNGKLTLKNELVQKWQIAMFITTVDRRYIYDSFDGFSFFCC